MQTHTTKKLSNTGWILASRYSWHQLSSCPYNSTVGAKNICLRVSNQCSRVSSLYAFAFTAKTGGRSDVATKRLESTVLGTLQFRQVALWLICLRSDACSTET